MSSEYRPEITAKQATVHRTASHIKALSDPKMSTKTLILDKEYLIYAS